MGALFTVHKLESSSYFWVSRVAFHMACAVYPAMHLALGV